MKTITKKEFIAFIELQPDERPVRMNQNCAIDPVGCAMVHYSKDNGMPIVYAGCHTFFMKGSDARLEGSLDSFFKMRGKRFTDCSNYGELKACLKK